VTTASPGETRQYASFVTASSPGDKSFVRTASLGEASFVLTVSPVKSDFNFIISAVEIISYTVPVPTRVTISPAEVPVIVF
jgi:hypothetical protein